MERTHALAGLRLGLKRGLIGILAIPLLYLGWAVVLGVVPVHPFWHEADRGITVYVRSNGDHVWIIVPKTTPVIDWRAELPGRDLADPRWDYGNHIGFGFGERDVYLNTPTWADLRVGTATRALVGLGTGLMHVVHDHDPRPDPWTRSVTLRPDEYRRLAGFIRASFAHGADGRPVLVPGRGYGPSDAFYESPVRYNAVYTCNTWAGRALQAAGVRIGLWTPLPQGILWRLD